MWGSGGGTPLIINLSIRCRGLWSASYCGCFAPGERAHGVNSLQERIGPTDGVNALVKKKNLLSLPAIEPRFLGYLACSPVLIRYLGL